MVLWLPYHTTLINCSCCSSLQIHTFTINTATLCSFLASDRQRREEGEDGSGDKEDVPVSKVCAREELHENQEMHSSELFIAFIVISELLLLLGGSGKEHEEADVMVVEE